MGYDPAHDYDDHTPPPPTDYPPRTDVCPDCGQEVFLDIDSADGTTHWTVHELVADDPARRCPNSGFAWTNCSRCNNGISRTMVFGKDDDGSVTHMLPLCNEVSRERGRAPSGRYRIDPRSGFSPRLTVAENGRPRCVRRRGRLHHHHLRPQPGRRWCAATSHCAGGPRGARTRPRILAEAAKIISGDREDVYGSAADGFARTGQLWAAILGIESINATQVALMLAALKISQLCTTDGHRDSWVDAAGYVALGADIALTIEGTN